MQKHGRGVEVKIRKIWRFRKSPENFLQLMEGGSGPLWPSPYARLCMEMVIRAANYVNPNC